MPTLCALITVCCALPAAAVVHFDAVAAAASQPQPSTEVCSLSGIWSFHYFPGSHPEPSALSTPRPAFSPITVPGCWELQGFAPPHYDTKGLAEGTGIYSRSFTVPAAWKNQRVYICFEGVAFGYSFTVNGQKAGSFNSAFNRAVFDITDFVDRSATNALVVTVSTWPRGYEFDTNDDWSLSGIYRDVYLFALPPTHIQDVRVDTKMDGTVSVAVDFAGPDAAKAAFIAELFDSSGKLVAAGSTSLKVSSPELWNAEHPYLYTLNIKSPFQTYTQKVGIREISWRDGVYKINGRPVKFHGATHHDLCPATGRTVSLEQMKKDLTLMKAGNMNFLRTSHYPPDHRLLDLCDEVGIYVMCEVPFGRGDRHLTDKSFLPDLQKRAWFTLHRDRNHPSIVIWSLGNENPVTKICLQLGDDVSALDPSRPWTFPLKPGDYTAAFARGVQLPVWSVHYLDKKRLQKFAAQSNTPFMMTEYAHALGLDFNSAQELYAEMFAISNVIGGSVWELFDQGITRKAGAPGAFEKKPTQKGAFTASVWLDANTYYDAWGTDGTDGILYADRTPQVDYYQLRKVYSPVQVSAATNGWIVQNRYDFTNLSALKARWTLFSDGQELSSGTLSLDLAPHATAAIPFPSALQSVSPTQGAARYVRLVFTDWIGQPVYERSILLSRPSPAARLSSFSESSRATSRLPLLFRTGRKATLCERFLAAQKRDMHFWPQKILAFSPIPPVGTAFPVRAACDATHSVTGTLALVSTHAALTYTYDLTMLSPKGGKSLEAGLAFQLPAGIETFRWLGDGPYPAYPGRDAASEYGVWALSVDDLYFPGNRRHVDLALFTDHAGAGYLLVLDHVDLAVERQPSGLVVGINSIVGTPYNKFARPRGNVDTDGLKIVGQVSVIPVASAWPPALRAIFGNPAVQPKAFAPFFNSYDQF